jgi:hypothetical protein
MTSSQIERDHDEPSQTFPQINRPIGTLQPRAMVELDNENMGTSWTSSVCWLSKV